MARTTLKISWKARTDVAIAVIAVGSDVGVVVEL